MPLLSLTLSGANGKPHDWTHVSTPLQEIQTLLNTTGLDSSNVQENGLLPSNIRTTGAVDHVRVKVRNSTGSSIAAGTLVYFNGTYSDGTTNYPTIAKAVSHATAGSNFFAQGILIATTANNADGTVAMFYELSGIDTSSTSVGDLAYLSTSAGGWTKTRPTGGQFIQVVGTITVVDASAGRIIFSFGSVPEFLTGESSGLGASLEALTVQSLSGAASDIFHIADAGEDNADKWKISVADGGTRTWENYTSGSYAAKLTLTPAGAMTVAGTVTSAGFVIGSADINEAELETIDGVTAGTVAASKAVVVDGNKDIASFRNVTLTGELDAGSLDVSGDADIDGTLEADAITLGGTALGSLYSPIAGSSSIVTVGTIGTGTWGATDVAVAHGGTGASSAADARTNLGLVIGTNVQAYDAGLNSISGLTTAANKMIYTSGSDTYAVADLSAFARSILDDADAAAVRTTIGAQASGSYQTSDAGLTSIAGLTTAADKMIYTSDSDTYAVTGLTSFARSILDDADAAAVRTTIGAQASGTYTTLAYKTISVSGQDNVVADAADDTLTLAAGTGITIATNATSDTVTITNSATGANAFGTVAVSGQDNVVADSTGDTLTLAAGSNVTLTTTAGSDTVTIAAAGGGHTIQEEGSSLTQRTNLNFVGAGVTATDDSGNNATKVTVTPTGASLPVTRSDGSTSDPIALTSAALGESLVSDTTPQLGGNLDVNGQSIVSDGSNENIPITPHGTGSVVVSKIDVAAGEIDGTAIGANSASTGAFTTLAASGTTTLSGDQVITDGNGLISGHTARVQVGWATGENQILGTADADANLSITRYSADNGPPNLFFGKSRGSLGANTIVADGDPLGRITFCGSDGVDMRSAAAWIEAECDGEFEADNVSGRIIFATTPDSSGVQDPTERVRIDSSGYLRMAGAGIQFNGDTAAANALDDYEEGTWTPVAKYDGLSGTSYSTGSSNVATYTKIGRVVYIAADYEITNPSADNDTSSVILTGLPFTSANIAAWWRITTSINKWTKTNGAGVIGAVGANDTYVAMYKQMNNGSWDGDVKTNEIYQSSGSVWIGVSGFYHI